MIKTVKHVCRNRFKVLNFYSPEISAGKNFSFISIYGFENYEDPPKFNGAIWKSGIQLQFDDVDDEIKYHAPVKRLSEDQCLVIVSFLENLHSTQEDENVVVHCLAGVSRSAAVAKFISDYYIGDRDKYSRNLMFNKSVYRKLEKCHTELKC